jgi:hypothetical protein
MQRASPVNVVDGMIEVCGGFRRAGWVGAPEGEVVEADVERPSETLGPLQRLRCASENLFWLALRK